MCQARLGRPDASDKAENNRYTHTTQQQQRFFIKKAAVISDKHTPKKRLDGRLHRRATLAQKTSCQFLNLK